MRSIARGYEYGYPSVEVRACRLRREQRARTAEPPSSPALVARHTPVIPDGGVGPLGDEVLGLWGAEVWLERWRAKRGGGNVGEARRFQMRAVVHFVAVKRAQIIALFREKTRREKNRAPIIRGSFGPKCFYGPKRRSEQANST